MGSEAEIAPIVSSKSSKHHHPCHADHDDTNVSHSGSSSSGSGSMSSSGTSVSSSEKKSRSSNKPVSNIQGVSTYSYNNSTTMVQGSSTAATTAMSYGAAAQGAPSMMTSAQFGISAPSSTTTTTVNSKTFVSGGQTYSGSLMGASSQPVISGKSPLAPGSVMTYSRGGSSAMNTAATGQLVGLGGGITPTSGVYLPSINAGATYPGYATGAKEMTTTTTTTNSAYSTTTGLPSYFTSGQQSGNVYGSTTTTAGGANYGYTATTGYLNGATTGAISTHTESSPMARSEMQRQVSNVIVREEYMQDLPKDEVRYVEVEVIEEVVKHVPRKEVIEVEKRVPKYEYEWVERVVEIPQIQYVDRPVEVTQIQEVVRHVPRTQIVDVPKEVIRHVPKIETKIVEKMVEVPGQIIEVPKPYTVENKIPVSNFLDADVPVVVAQTTKPIIVQSDDVIDVDVVQHEPEVIPVDVHVIKPVAATACQTGMRQTHRVVSIPSAQYNTILRLLNTHMESKDIAVLPYVIENGTTPFLDASVKGSFAVAGDDIEIEGLSRAIRRRVAMSRRIGGSVAAAAAAAVQQQQQQQIYSSRNVSQQQVMVPGVIPGGNQSGMVMMREGGVASEVMSGNADLIQEAATIRTLENSKMAACCGMQGRRVEAANYGLGASLMPPATNQMLRAVSSSTTNRGADGRQSKGNSTIEIRNYEMAADGTLMETLAVPKQRRACC